MADELDVLKQVARVREHVVPELRQADVERLVAVASSRRERRRLRRSLGLGLAIGALGASALWLVERGASFGSLSSATVPSARAIDSGRVAGTVAAPVQSSQSAPRPARTWALSDRSRVTALAPVTEVVIEEDALRRASLRIGQGRARFEVARRPERTFLVRAGSVTVSVVGTVFEVEVVADRIGVAVAEGAVDVDWGVGQQRLVAGDHGWFPPLVMSGGDAADAGGSPSANEPSPATTASPAASAFAVGLERRAPALSSQAGTSSARELLVESDAARTRGELQRGAELLRRILREHPNDPRAPLAAFTLGRLLLNELGKPREAATTFQELQRRAPRGQFAEDALAREAEAWKQASEPARARAVAKTYLERYPQGRHVRRIKALAGLE